MITRISKVVFPPKTVGKPLRTTKLNFAIIKIPYVNTIKKGFLCDKKIPHLQKFIYSSRNISSDHQKRFKNQKSSVLSQVVVLLLLLSAGLSYSSGDSSKISYQSRWNLSNSSVQSRVLDSNDEGKLSHFCPRRNAEKYATNNSEISAPMATQFGNQLVEISEVSRSITNRSTDNNNLRQDRHRFGQQHRHPALEQPL